MEKSKKRIMLIVPMLDQGGLERVCAMTARILNKEYIVRLVVFNTEGMVYDVSGVDMTNLGLGAVDGRIGKIINVLKRVRRVRKLKKQMNIQLCYSFGPTANLVNVLSKHKDVTWAGIRGYGALGSKGAMKLICRRADRVISCTRVMEQLVSEQFHPRKTAVVYNPCDITQIKEQSMMEASAEFGDFFARKGRTIVSMGREHDVKGFWHLIKAVYLVRRDLPDVRLIIIGAGDYHAYKILARELGMDKEVLFTGMQSNPFALLKKADIYALTSESEGFPNALIEAMAVGLPCVSVNCLTGPAEILNEDYEKCGNRNQIIYADYGILTGIFHGDRDMDATRFSKEEEEFAAELKRLLEDEKMYRHYKEVAIKRAEDFSVERYLTNMKNLIEQDI